MTKKSEAESGVEELVQQALVPTEEQPYQVPANWLWVRLKGAFFQVRQQFNPLENESCNYIGLEHLKKGGGIDSVSISTELKSQKNCFIKNDLLYGKLRPYLNKHAVVDFEGIVSTDIVVLRPNGVMSSSLLDYYLNLPLVIQYAVANSKGINLPRISPIDLEGLPMPLPPLPEQQRIVSTIESLFAKLDRARELLEEVQDAFEEQKATILARAFRGELTAKWREERGLSIETAWKRREIKDICKLSSGGTPSRTLSEYYSGNIPWIKTGEINWNYIFDSEEKISQEALKNSSAKLFPEGTVLLAMYGQGLTRGRAAILSIDAATNQAVCGLLPNAELNNKYLFFYFMNNYWELRENAVGGNQPNFSMTIVGGFEIEVPPLSEQLEIVHILDDLLDQSSTAANLCDQMEQIDQLKKTILAKAFRGELDTNDPAEESAEKLLREVLRQRTAVGAGKAKVKL